MAGCAGWLFDIMNESGYGWGSYSPLICIREGGREEGIKKNGVAISSLLLGFCPLVARHITGVLVLLPPHQVSGTTKVVPYCI